MRADGPEKPGEGALRLLVFCAGLGMVTLASPLSCERATNRHQLLHDLPFTRLAVVNPCLAFQRKRGAAKRAAVAGVKEVSPQSIDRPGMATIVGGSFSLKP